MAKLLLLSGVMMALWWPIMAARDPRQQRGLRRVIYGLFLYNLFYVFAVLVIYPRIA